MKQSFQFNIERSIIYSVFVFFQLLIRIRIFCLIPYFLMIIRFCFLFFCYLVIMFSWICVYWIFFLILRVTRVFFANTIDTLLQFPVFVQILNNLTVFIGLHYSRLAMDILRFILIRIWEYIFSYDRGQI